MEILDHLKPFIHWIELHPHLTGFFVFIVSLLESLAFVGILFPGTVFMTAAGLLIGAGISKAAPLMSYAILGAVMGDVFSYHLGHHYKNHIRELPLVKRYIVWLQRGESYFVRHGGKSVFLGRFCPLRPVVPVIAGMMNMSPLRFYVSNIASALIWGPVYMIPGIIIGAAASQLPPDVASRLLVILLVVLLVIALTAWLFKKIIFMVVTYIRRVFDAIWHSIKAHPSMYPIYQLLRDPCSTVGHRQLNLLMIACVLTLALGILSLMVLTNSGPMTWNTPVFIFFRSLHNEDVMKVMILLTYIGDRYILGPTAVAICLWLAWKKQWYLAFHWLAIFLTSFGIVAVIKFLIHSPRPDGLSGSLVNNSFPSGHVTIAIAYYSFFAATIIRNTKRELRSIIYSVTTIVCGIIIFTRLYLGAHWTTDVIGGTLAGLLCASIVIISYRRRAPKPINLHQYIAVVLVSFLIFFGIKVKTHYADDIAIYTPQWPQITLSVNNWWEQGPEKAVLYRDSRFGNPLQLINIQWAGTDKNIKDTLLVRGWEELSSSTLINALNHMSPDGQKIHVNLIPPLLQGKAPKMIFIKAYKDNHFIILRFWPSNVTFKDTTTPLWFGILDYHNNPNYRLKRHTKKNLFAAEEPPIELLYPALQTLHVKHIPEPHVKKPKNISASQWKGGILFISSIPTEAMKEKPLKK